MSSRQRIVFFFFFSVFVLLLMDDAALSLTGLPSAVLSNSGAAMSSTPISSLYVQEDLTGGEEEGEESEGSVARWRRKSSEFFSQSVLPFFSGKNMEVETTSYSSAPVCPKCEDKLREISIFSLGAHNMLDQIAHILRNMVRVRNADFFDFGPYCLYSFEIKCWSPFKNPNSPPRTPKEQRHFESHQPTIGSKDHHITYIHDEGEVRRLSRIIASRAEFKRADLVLCIFPPGPICRILEDVVKKATKKFLIVPGWRFDQNLGEQDACDWARRLKALLSDGVGVMGSISKFDVQYAYHFLNIPPSENVFIDTCINNKWLKTSDKISDSERCSRPEFLFFPARKNYPGKKEPNYRIYKRVLAKHVNEGERQLFPARQIYERFEIANLVRHKGIVWIPYAPTICALVEQYSAGITIWVPSKQLLTTWILNPPLAKYPVMYDTMNPPEVTCYAPGVTAETAQHPYPPHDMLSSPEGAQYWLNFTFFYTNPFFKYFDSPQDLRDQLRSWTSEKAKVHSRKQRDYVRQNLIPEAADGWRALLGKIYPECDASAECS